MKEIHFYTNLCNKEQISDEFITDVLVDWVSTNKAIYTRDKKIVRTTQLSFLRDTWSYIGRGYKVYIHNGIEVLEVKEGMEGTNKDIKNGIDLSRFLIGGGFGELC